MRVNINIANILDFRAHTFEELLRIAILEFNGKKKVHDNHCELDRQAMPIDYAATIDNYAQVIQGVLGQHLDGIGPKVYVSPSGRGQYTQESNQLDKKYVKKIRKVLEKWEDNQNLNHHSILSYLYYNPDNVTINAKESDYGVPLSTQEVRFYHW